MSEHSTEATEALKRHAAQPDLMLHAICRISLGLTLPSSQGLTDAAYAIVATPRADEFLLLSLIRISEPSRPY